MISLNQRKYVETVLQRFNMQESKSVKVPIPVGVNLSVEQCPKTQEEEEDMSQVPYASAVGSLMYAMVYTRLNIAHAVGVLIRYMSKLGKDHWIDVKRVFIYFHGTTDYAIFLSKNSAYHAKTKHIDVQYHFVRDMVEDKKVTLEKVGP